MASNISVAITVDNKQYLAGINAANTATQTFGRNANKTFGDLGLVSDNLIARLGGLKTAIAGLIGATALQQANNYANAIKDISTTSDLSIETVLGLSRAFEVNGGTAEGAQNAILKFADSIAQARQGNDSALKSFKDIGISINDLNNNGIEQLTKKSIAGIAGLSSATAQIRTQTDLFGKTAKGVSFGGVQQATQQQYISPETVAALKSGADASENMKKQFSQLTEALLKVAQPLNDIVKTVNITATAFESLIKAIVAAISAYLLFGRGVAAVGAIADTAIKAIRGAGGVIAMLSAPIKAVVADLTGFVKMWYRVITGAASAATVFGAVIGSAAMLGRVLLRFAGFIGLFIALAEAVNFFTKQFFNRDIIDEVTKKISNLIDKTREWLGLKPSEAAGAGAGRGGNAETLRQQQEEGERQRRAYEEQQQAVKDYQERVTKLGIEIRKIGDSYAYNNDHQLQALALEARLIGKTEDEIEVAKGLADIYKQQDDTLKQLVDTRKQWAMGTEDQRNNLGIIDAEIAKIKKLTTTYVEDYQTYIGAVQGKRTIEKARLADIENMIKAMEAQLKIQEALSSAKLNIIGQKQDVAFEGSKTGKGNLQKQMMDIAEANRKAGLEASRAFANAFEEGGDGLTPERARELQSGLDAIAQGYKDIGDAQMVNLNASREWSNGWKEAFATYAEDALNAADQSKTYFDTFTKGFEDAFVKLVQTGKLSFKDLANSLIAEFARIQAKKLLASAFDMGGGGGGFSFGTLFGSIGKLFGFANGGQIPTNGPVVVGERGPELLTGARGLNVIPNNMLNMNSQQPQQVTTNVTYQIQAVDASSFRTLLARDPEFLYNVTQQGRRSMPIGSR
jgi:lambda family phage tail tape measure protein